MQIYVDTRTYPTLTSFSRSAHVFPWIIIFNPNKKQNGAMEQISTFYLKFMPPASDTTSIKPHIWWRDLTKPSSRVWPCRPWWTLPEMIKFAWESAVVQYSKSPCPKNTRKFDIIFFLLKSSIFAEPVKFAEN